MARIKSGVGSFFAKITGRGEGKPKTKLPPVADPGAEVITTAEIIAVHEAPPPPPGKD